MNHTIRMEEIRSTVGSYPMKMVYNMDETGLFYRQRPNRTYLLASGDRRNTGGTELQKHKSRVTAVLCVNAYGSHALPPRYVGKSVSPKCLNDPRFSHYRNFYSSQLKGSIGSDGFDLSIKWWHKEAEKHNPGPKLLIMDNFGGNSVNANLHGVRIITLPPRTTAQHQQLDLGLIGNSKVPYRSLILQSVIRVMKETFRNEIEFRSDSQRGMYGIREGQLP